MSSTVPTQQKPQQPSPELLTELPGGLNPVDLWLNLHTAEQSWKQIEDKAQRYNVIASNRLMLESLADFPVERWLAFNHAIGWIPAAVAAITWCKGAALAQCVAVWIDLGLMPELEPGADFTARLINPALLPSLSFNALAASAENYLPSAALLIAARDDAPIMDMDNPQKYVNGLRRELGQMLALRGAIPPEWVRPATPTAAAPSTTAPKPPEPKREPEHLNGTIANMLRQRKEARNWSDEQIEAAKAFSEGVEVSGFPYLKAFRYLLPGSARSVVADEKGRLLHVGRDDYVYSDTLARTSPAELPPMDVANEGQKAPKVIFVPLFGEFIDVWCPVHAERLHGAVFQIADRQRSIFRDEAWGTNYGPRVECEARLNDGELMLFFKRDAEGRW